MQVGLGIRWTWVPLVNVLLVSPVGREASAPQAPSGLCYITLRWMGTSTSSFFFLYTLSISAQFVNMTSLFFIFEFPADCSSNCGHWFCFYYGHHNCSEEQHPCASIQRDIAVCNTGSDSRCVCYSFFFRQCYCCKKFAPSTPTPRQQPAVITISSILSNEEERDN